MTKSPFSGALRVCTRDTVLHARRKPSHRCRRWNLPAVRRHRFELSLKKKKIHIFPIFSCKFALKSAEQINKIPFRLWSNSHISSSHPVLLPPDSGRGFGVSVAVGGVGGACDDRCLYSLREIETHNESGRCVSRGCLPPLVNHWMSLASELTLPALNTHFGSLSGDGIVSLRLHRLHRISRLFFFFLFFLVWLHDTDLCLCSLSCWLP